MLVKIESEDGTPPIWQYRVFEKLAASQAALGSDGWVPSLVTRQFQGSFEDLRADILAQAFLAANQGWIGELLSFFMIAWLGWEHHAEQSSE